MIEILKFSRGWSHGEPRNSNREQQPGTATGNINTPKLQDLNSWNRQSNQGWMSFTTTHSQAKAGDEQHYWRPEPDLWPQLCRTASVNAQQEELLQPCTSAREVLQDDAGGSPSNWCRLSITGAFKIICSATVSRDMAAFESSGNVLLTGGGSSSWMEIRHLGGMFLWGGAALCEEQGSRYSLGF